MSFETSDCKLEIELPGQISEAKADMPESWILTNHLKRLTEKMSLNLPSSKFFPPIISFLL